MECLRLTTQWKEPLLEFLSALLDSNDTQNFYPHQFTAEAVEQIIHNSHSDLYYVLVEGDHVLGYGLLRGWDEGFEIPSLGIAIHPNARGIGLGRALMLFLSVAAKRKGARKIRLRVKLDNLRARALYESLGYKFESEENNYLIGFLALDQIEDSRRTSRVGNRE